MWYNALKDLLSHPKSKKRTFLVQLKKQHSITQDGRLGIRLLGIRKNWCALLVDGQEIWHREFGFEPEEFPIEVPFKIEDVNFSLRIEPLMVAIEDRVYVTGWRTRFYKEGEPLPIN